METTVRDLSGAIVRHFLLAVVSGIATWLLFVAVIEWEHPVAFAHPLTVLMLIAAASTYYHWREFRGKSWRYHNQRRRAANERLRADFHRRW